MYTRRDFISVTAAAAAATIVGCQSSLDDKATAVVPSGSAGFPKSMSQAARIEMDDPLTVISGAIPSDMDGHAFTIGSIPGNGNGPQVVGDGFVYRLSFGPESIRLKSCVMRTDCFLLDEASKGDPELAFEDKTFVRVSPAFGVRNFANTAFQPIQDGRLLVTYDAGRPWEIDPTTLEIITPVGLQTHWKPFLPALTPSLNFMPLCMTSAHPAYDADDRMTYMANFAAPVDGLATDPFTRLLWWDGESEPQSCEVLDIDGKPAAIEMACHQIAVTQNHIVLFDTAFRLEAESFFGGDLVTRPALPHTGMWIIAKQDLKNGGSVTAQRAVVPIEGAHAIVLRDDTDDILNVLVAHQNSFDPSEWVAKGDVVHQTGQPINPDYSGLLVQPADRSVIGKYAIRISTGEVLSRELFSDEDSWAFVLFSQDLRESGERFGNFYWGTFGYDPELLTQRYIDAYSAHPERQVALQDLPTKQVPSQIVRFDADQFEVADRFTMPLGYIGLSPTFVPRRGGDMDEGYVVLFVVSDQDDEIWVFDSKDLNKGPLCRLGHSDLDFAFTLHTAWLPTLVPANPSTYSVDKSEDYSARLERLSPKAQAVAKEILKI